MSDQAAAPPSLTPGSVPDVPRGGELKWVKVIGIISVIFGILGVFSSLSMFFAGEMQKLPLKLMAATQEISSAKLAEFDSVIAKWSWISYTSGILFLVANSLLLLGGIFCLKMKSKSRGLFLGYVGVMVLYGCFMIWVFLGTSMAEEQTRVMSDIQGLPESSVDTQLLIGRITGLVTVFFYLIFPVFVLIWFLRGKITNDIKTRFS